MPSFTINPHARRRPYELEQAGRPRIAVMLLALTGIWIAALVLGAAGFHAEYGEWAPFGDLVWLPLFLGPLALPQGLFYTLGNAGLGILAIPLAILFWPAVAGLQFLAVYRRRWIYAAPVPLLVFPAAWNWTTHAVGMMSV